MLFSNRHGSSSTLLKLKPRIQGATGNSFFDTNPTFSTRLPSKSEHPGTFGNDYKEQIVEVKQAQRHSNTPPTFEGDKPGQGDEEDFKDEIWGEEAIQVVDMATQEGECDMEIFYREADVVSSGGPG